MKITLENLQRTYNLTLKDDKIYVYPLNRINIMYDPLPPLERCVLISAEEFVGFLTLQSIFSDDNYTEVLDFEDPSDEEWERQDIISKERQKYYFNVLGLEMQ